MSREMNNTIQYFDNNYDDLFDIPTKISFPLTMSRSSSMSSISSLTTNKDGIKTKKKSDNYTTIMRRKLRHNMCVSEDLRCNICSSTFDEGICTRLPCDHCFHRNCVNIWLKESQSCPTCATKLNDDIPTIDYIKEKYPLKHLKQTMLEYGIITKEKDCINEDDMIYKVIHYFESLSSKASLSLSLSNDSIKWGEL